jgi:hypothetical protein
VHGNHCPEYVMPVVSDVIDPPHYVGIEVVLA